MDSKEAVANRIKKAIEVKQGLTSNGITNDTCPDIVKFHEIMNEWVRDGLYKKGAIKIPEVNKKIVYQLAGPKHTVVKLSQM